MCFFRVCCRICKKLAYIYIFFGMHGFQIGCYRPLGISYSVVHSQLQAIQIDGIVDTEFIFLNETLARSNNAYDLYEIVEKIK